jgi:hypothetical protein
MIKNKKGEEEEGTVANTMGTILALTATIVIVIFIYIAITQIVRDNELEAAKSIADKIKAKIDAIEPGQNNTFTFQGNKDLGENKWYILGWNKADASKPDKCFFSNSCICICKGSNFGASAGDCQTKGICREFETRSLEIKELFILEKTRDGQTTYIQGGIPVTPKIGTGEFYVSSIPIIPVPKNFFILEIKKEQDNITVSHYSDSYLQNKDKLPKT